jgi:hypothetical protein
VSILGGIAEFLEKRSTRINPPKSHAQTKTCEKRKKQMKNSVGT